MKVIVGLGNPGGKCSFSRHNVGFVFLDLFSKRVAGEHLEVSVKSWSVTDKYMSLQVGPSPQITLVKPRTFMNKSGIAIKKFVKYNNVKPGDLWVVHDDLDIKLGEYKIQEGVGPKDHKGVNSIEEQLGFSGFWRIRIGVDNRGLKDRIPGEDYVLKDFPKEERQKIDEVMEKIFAELIDNYYPKWAKENKNGA